MNYSTAIKTIRNKLNLSQMEMADMLKVSFATINRWENGHHQPTIKAKRKLDSLMKEHDIHLSSKEDYFEYCLKHKEEYPLIERALTDTSYSEFEKAQKKTITPNNEILATYGDAVLKLAFCEVLYDDKELSVHKANYECDKSLVLIGEKYNILKYMKMNDKENNLPKDYKWSPNKKNEDKSHKHIATCIEAIIGAIYHQNKDMEEIVQIARCWKEYIDSHKL